jgi:hypothetical protein
MGGGAKDAFREGELELLPGVLNRLWLASLVDTSPGTFNTIKMKGYQDRFHAGDRTARRPYLGTNSSTASGNGSAQSFLRISNSKRSTPRRFDNHNAHPAEKAFRTKPKRLFSRQTIHPAQMHLNFSPPPVTGGYCQAPMLLHSHRRSLGQPERISTNGQSRYGA